MVSSEVTGTTEGSYRYHPVTAPQLEVEMNDVWNGVCPEDILRMKQEAEMDEKLYRVVHRATKFEYRVSATSAAQACLKCGWELAECRVQVIGGKR